MAYHDVIFPIEVRSQQGTPVWPVDIIGLGGGSEQRVVLQPDARRQYEATHSALTLAQARDILKFFNGRRGPGYSFKVRDKLLYTTTAEPIGVAGGIGTTMQLTLNEGDASNAYNREIYLPESGSVVIKANSVTQTEGVDYSLNYNGANGGKLTWITNRSGQTITADFRFYVPVRFDAKSLPDIEVIFWRSNNTGSVTGPTVPMIEVDYPGEWV
jgi:uncharacterized protein (TIGR02217 family)